MSVCSNTILILMAGMSLALGQIVTAPPDPEKCVILQEQECLRLGYNSTYLPNLRGHLTQEEADREFRDFLPLVDKACSNAILHFLCSFYFPICFVQPFTHQSMKLNPCRGLCEYVEGDCRKVLIEAHFGWPAFFNCSQKDSFSEQQPCFGQDDLSTVTIPDRGMAAVSTNSDATAGANEVSISWWLLSAIATLVAQYHLYN